MELRPGQVQTLARIAYEGYCAQTGWKSLATGDALPHWPDLPVAIREAWEASVRAIARRIYRSVSHRR
jgi:hypothetical protein